MKYLIFRLRILTEPIAHPWVRKTAKAETLADMSTYFLDLFRILLYMPSRGNIGLLLDQVWIDLGSFLDRFWIGS